jgi:hypothetical protein
MSNINYINTGSSPNKGDGDTLRTAFTKINQNFQFISTFTGAGYDGIGEDITPLADNTYSLGSPTNSWKNVYVGGNLISSNSSTGVLGVNGQDIVTTQTFNLLIASSSSLGVIKIGSGINIDSSGTISVEQIPGPPGPVFTTVATTSTLGLVRVDGTSTVMNNGVLQAIAPPVPLATSVTPGIVQVDGTSTIMNNGVIQAFVPIATTLTLGKVRVDGTTIGIDSNGVLEILEAPLNLTTVSSNIIPSLDLSYDIGSSTKRWQNIYGRNIIGAGATTDLNIITYFVSGTTSTVVTNTWTFTNNGTLEFPDGTIQSTAYTGPDTSTVSVSTSTLVNNSATVSLNSDGTLSFPNNILGASSGTSLTITGGRGLNATGFGTGRGGDLNLRAGNAVGDFSAGGDVHLYAGDGFLANGRVFLHTFGGTGTEHILTFNAVGDLELPTYDNSGSNVTGIVFGDGTTQTTAYTGTNFTVTNVSYFTNDAGYLTATDVTLLADTLDSVLARGSSTVQTITAGHIVPSADKQYDLGTSSTQWRSLYVGTATIYIDNIPLSIDATNNTVVVGPNEGRSVLASQEFVNIAIDGIPAGPKGDQGVQGNTGTQGVQGPIGPQGIQGNTGTVGIQGPIGNTGTQGVQGPIGDTGAQGISIVLVGSSATTTVESLGAGSAGQGWINSTDGDVYFWNTLTTQWENIGPIVGPQGERGLQGVQGAQGEQGIQGAKGDTGAQGSTGTQGVQGPVGPQGEQGIQGNTGTQGLIGPTGPKGDRGDTGLTGSTGPQGATGPQGTTGSAATITLGTVTVSTSTASVTNVGTTSSAIFNFVLQQGPQGIQGPAGAQGEPGADALWNWQGAYGAGPQYQEGDIVSYQGSTYRRNATGNSVVGEPPTNTTYWQIVAQKGADGTGGGVGDRLVNGDYEVVLGADGTLTLSTSSNALYTTTNALIKSFADIQISAGDDVGSNWVFGGDGVLTLPGGNTRIGNVFGSDAIVGNTGTSVGVLVQGQGASGGVQWVDNPENIGTTSSQVQVAAVVVNSQLALTTGTVQVVTGVTTGTGIGSNTWEFGADGNLTIPDDIQDANGSVVRVATTSTAPTRVDGQLWFNTLEGRLYIKYSDAWVDAAPLVMPAPDTDIDVASITFPDASVQTTAWTGDSGSSWQLTSGTSVVSLDSNGVLTLPNGASIGSDNSSSGIPMTTDRGTILFGNVPEVGPTGSSHFHIMKDDPTNVDLFFGDDYNYVKLPSNNGVQIGTGGNIWEFGTDGNLTLPLDSSIQTIGDESFARLRWLPTGGDGSSTETAVIVASNGVSILTDSPSDENTWLFGTDGVLTLPSSSTISDGTGAIRLEPAGVSSSTQALLIYPTAQDGNHIHLTAGGGETDLYLGNDSQYVKVDHSGTIVIGTLGANTSTWTFATDGSTTLPIGVSIDEYNGSHFPRIVADPGKAFSVQGQGSTGSVALQWIETESTSSQIAQVGLNKFGDGLAKVVLTAGTSTNEMKIWEFAADGSLTFPDATVQTTAFVQGEQIFTVNTGTTAYAPTAVDFNLLFVTSAVGYSETDPTSVTLPAGVPGQRLVIFNGYNLATLTVNPGPVSRDISSGVVAEFIYSGFDGLWIPLYGTNSPT